jgi:hypothetical protein
MSLYNAIYYNDYARLEDPILLLKIPWAREKISPKIIYIWAHVLKKVHHLSSRQCINASQV